MKSIISLLPFFELLAVGAIVVSCSNSAARFAKEIPGVWQGTPAAITDNTAITATIIDTYEFGPAAMTAAQTLSGPVTVTGMVNTTTQIVSDSTMVEPMGLSASAHTTISGTWTVIDDDEISLSFDPQTLVIDVDPDGVIAKDNGIALSSPAVDSIRPALIKSIEQGLRQALTARYASMRHMDDVKIKGVMFKYESNDEDFVLTKQE